MHSATSVLRAICPRANLHWARRLPSSRRYRRLLTARSGRYPGWMTVAHRYSR